MRVRDADQQEKPAPIDQGGLIDVNLVASSLRPLSVLQHAGW
jgi:hypothetical protein